MLGGADANAGIGGIAQITVAGAWAADDTFSVTLTTPSDGRSQTLGAGAVTNQNPTFALTYNKKLYLLGGGQTLFFSALNAPTQFNDLNAVGNGFMDLSNEYGFSDNLVAAAIYQGKLANFARRSIQIVVVDADPANYQVVQTLENIGTVNGDSVRNMGDLDVVFCSDSGFRSLRVLDSSGKLTPFDLGTPIDSLVQARLLAAGTSQMASIVEPISNRLWEAIGNLIYVFSYFPNSGVAAWSTYEASVPLDPVSTTWGALPANSWLINYSGLTIGRTYRFTRGAVELGATSCVIADGSFTPYLTNADGTFVATATTATALITTTTAPAAATCILGELFTPEKFEIYNGQIYVRATTGQVYRYGGAANATYDASPCSWETPWLDARSAPTQKLGGGIDAGLEGGWLLSLGSDPVSGVLKLVYASSTSTFGKGMIPKATKGTHFKAKGVTSGAAYARFSTFAYHFEGGDAR